MRSKKIKTEIYWNQREIVLTFTNKNFFFLSRFSFTYTNDSQDSRGREGTIFYFTLPRPPAHEHWDIYLQLWMWGDYHVFLIATLVFTRLLLDEICHLIELPFDWLIDDAMFVCVLDELILGFCYSDLAWDGNFTKSKTPPWVFSAVFKLCKWNQIVQSVGCTGINTIVALIYHIKGILRVSFVALS